MKKTLKVAWIWVALWVHAFSLQGQECIRVCSWNIANLGGSKSDEEIAYMAKTLRDMHLVAVQEVSTGSGGPQAVARLDDALDRTGYKWDYVVSNPTIGKGIERYAFLWRTDKVQIKGDPYLAKEVADSIDREPFWGVFKACNTTIHALSFHAVPAGKNPSREIRLLQTMNMPQDASNIVIMGDFNLDSNADAFDWLYRAGFDDLLEGVRTTIKMQPAGTQNFANSYDNFIFKGSTLSILDANRVDITPDFPTLQECRLISDHAPIFMELKAKP